MFSNTVRHGEIFPITLTFKQRFRQEKRFDVNFGLSGIFFLFLFLHAVNFSVQLNLLILLFIFNMD